MMSTQSGYSRQFSCGRVAILLALTTASTFALSPELSNRLKILSFGETTDSIQGECNQEIVVSGNTVHMAWIANVYSDYWNAGTTNRLFYRRSLDGGITWQPAVMLDETDQLVVEETKARRMLAVDGESVHVVSLRATSGGDWYYMLDYFRSTDNGASFEARQTFRASDNLWHMAHPFVVAAGGKVNIFYDYRPNWYTRGIIAQMRSEDSGQTFKTGSVLDVSQSLSLADARGQGADVALAFMTGYNIPGSYAWSYNLNAAVSTDSGLTFKIVQDINGKSGDGHGHVDDPTDYHEKTDIIKTGNLVYLVWTGLDTNNFRYVFVARSTDEGASFETPVNLYRLLPGGSPAPQCGHATVAAKGNCVYIVCTTTSSREFYWYSSDAGVTYQAGELTVPTGTTTTSGWWPLVQIDPSSEDGRKVHFFCTPDLYACSTDGGQTISSLAHHSTCFSWANTFPKNPQWAIGTDGTVHLTWTGAYLQYAQNFLYTDPDIFYERVLPTPPAFSQENRAISLWGNQAQSRWDNLQIPYGPDLAFTNALTVEAWVKCEAECGQDTTILYKESAAQSAGSIVLQTHSWASKRRPSAKLKTAAKFYELWGTELLADGAWNHLALTYDAAAGTNNLRLYVNGKLSAATTATGNIEPGAGLIWVGKSTSANNVFVGAIDEVRLWTRCLTEAEIYNSLGGPRSGNEAGLVAYLPLDDSTADATGRSHDGVLMYKESFTSGFYRMPVFESTWLTSAGCEQPFVWKVSVRYATALTAAGLPPGLSLDSTTRLITGAPTRPGVYDATIVASNFQASASQVLRIVVRPTECASFREEFNSGLGAAWNASLGAAAFYSFESGLMNLRGNNGDTYQEYNRALNLFAYSNLVSGDFIVTLGVARYEPSAVSGNRLVITAWDNTDNYVRYGYGFGYVRLLETISEKSQVAAGTSASLDFGDAPFLLQLRKETVDGEGRYVSAYSTNGVDFITVSALTVSNTAVPAWLGFWLGVDQYLDNHAWIDSFEVVAVPPPNTYTRWLYDHGLGGAQAAPGASLNHDGVINLLRYAVGVAPEAPVTGKLPAYQLTDSEHLVFTYRQRTGGTGTTGVDYTAAGVTYAVETADELGGSWQNNLDSVELLPGSRIDNGDGTETVSVMVKLPANAEAKFVRLALTQH